MIKTYKVMLLPNKKQLTRLTQFAGSARFAYNWALSTEIENYKVNKTFIQENSLKRLFTDLKQEPEYKWLYTISNDVTKQAIKDAVGSYEKFFKKITKFPKFKSKKRNRPSFYQDTCKIRLTATHVRIEKLALSRKANKQKLNLVKLAESYRVPFLKGTKYINPRVTFDGLNWWLSVGIECGINLQLPTNEGLGIDLGISSLATCSDGTVYSNINKTQPVCKAGRRLKRLQRRVSKKYLLNKKDNKFCKTNNISKLERRTLKVSRRLTNLRHNYLHQITSELINRKPIFITIEDLNVAGMMKNKHLSKSLQDQSFNQFKTLLQYKCNWNNIELRQVSRWFPSSKTCSNCGTLRKSLKLSERVFHCEHCNLIMDRDLNASLNLKHSTEFKVLTNKIPDVLRELTPTDCYTNDSSSSFSELRQVELGI